MSNPDIPVKTWSGEVELDLGDLGFQIADFWCEYTHDGTTWSLGSYTLKAFQSEKKYLKDGKPFHEHCIVDLTDLVSEHAVEDIFNQYIVNEG